MKLHERSSQRFVKEYANWKISILEDMAKSHPEKALILTANITVIKENITVIKENIKGWDRGYVTTDEVMRIISEF